MNDILIRIARRIKKYHLDRSGANYIRCGGVYPAVTDR